LIYRVIVRSNSCAKIITFLCVKWLYFQQVNGFCLTFFKADCLAYLYLTVDVYNSHFCHLKFYPQNTLYFQNITNETKSILFIIAEVPFGYQFIFSEVVVSWDVILKKSTRMTFVVSSTRGWSLLSTVRYALKIYILIISILMIRRHLQCSLTTFKIVSGL
jgi:hypothetical protein